MARGDSPVTCMEARKKERIFQSPIDVRLCNTPNHCPRRPIMSVSRPVLRPLVRCSRPPRPTISREKCLVAQSLSCPQMTRVRLSASYRRLLFNSSRYPRQTPAATTAAAGATTTKATAEKGTACPRGGIIGRGERGRVSRGSSATVSKGTVESTEAWGCGWKAGSEEAKAERARGD